MNEAQSKQNLKVVIPKLHEEPSRVTKTPGTSSSHVCKIRIVSGERTVSAPIFLDEDLSCDTPNNTLSSVVSSGSIKIGYSFENKGYLKMMLHLYAMKRNFEFKVKNLGKDIWFITCIYNNCS